MLDQGKIDSLKSLLQKQLSVKSEDNINYGTIIGFAEGIINEFGNPYHHNIQDPTTNLEKEVPAYWCGKQEHINALIVLKAVKDVIESDKRISPELKEKYFSPLLRRIKIVFDNSKELFE
jgi:hypothetical protein